MLEDGDDRSTSIVPLLFGLPVASAVVGLIIGGLRKSAAKATEAVAPVEQAAELFIEKKLGMTAYSILAVVLLVIFGGLAWCFWKAMQAAGRRDPQINDAA